MRIRDLVTASVLTILVGIGQGALAGASSLALERLRLNDEGKLQVDVVVRSDPAPGVAEIEFVDRRGRETVTVVGLAAVNLRRIATATKPLPCGESQEVTATIVAPEHVKGPRTQRVLTRRCDFSQQPSRFVGFLRQVRVTTRPRIGGGGVAMKTTTPLVGRALRVRNQ